MTTAQQFWGHRALIEYKYIRDTHADVWGIILGLQESNFGERWGNMLGSVVHIIQQTQCSQLQASSTRNSESKTCKRHMGNYCKECERLKQLLSKLRNPTLNPVRFLSWLTEWIKLFNSKLDTFDTTVNCMKWYFYTH